MERKLAEQLRTHQYGVSQDTILQRKEVEKRIKDTIENNFSEEQSKININTRKGREEDNKYLNISDNLETSTKNMVKTMEQEEGKDNYKHERDSSLEHDLYFHGR